MTMADPNRVPRQQLQETASAMIADAWVEMGRVIEGTFPGMEMTNMVFAVLLTALVRTARTQGVPSDQINGELGNQRVDETMKALIGKSREALDMIEFVSRDERLTAGDQVANVESICWSLVDLMSQLKEEAPNELRNRRRE